MLVSVHKLRQHFLTLLQQHQLNHAYLLTGEAEATASFSLWLAQLYFCRHLTVTGPCGHCPECKRVLSDNHPDVIRIAPNPQRIMIEQTRQLKRESVKTGLEQNRRLFFIQDAHTLTTAAANSLLKFIEEPSPGTLIVLTSPQPDLLLPTIRSRVQSFGLQADSLSSREQVLANLKLEPTTCHWLAKTDLAVSYYEAWHEHDNLNQWVSTLKQWVMQCLKQDPLSYSNVQSQIMPLFKDKDRQLVAYQLIELMVQDWLDQQLKTNDSACDLEFDHVILTTTLMLHPYRQANVSFQNNIEHFCLQLLQARRA